MIAEDKYMTFRHDHISIIGPRAAPSTFSNVILRQELSVDEDVTVSKRHVRVKGPRGVLKRDFTHLAIDLKVAKDGRKLTAELWFGERIKVACIRTVLSHINNMIVGVTKGYLYKMRMVYAHFPISVSLEKNNTEVQVRNFLGEKEVRVIQMFGDVTCTRSTDGTKDELIVQGTDLDAVSQSAANIQQSIRVTDKDIRKYLDGCYVSWKGNVVQEE